MAGVSFDRAGRMRKSAMVYFSDGFIGELGEWALFVNCGERSG